MQSLPARSRQGGTRTQTYAHLYKNGQEARENIYLNNVNHNEWVQEVNINKPKHKKRQGNRYFLGLLRVTADLFLNF